MTVIAVPAEPPWSGLVLSELAETSLLSEAEATGLYAVMFKDVCIAAERLGGDLLVNYRVEDELPDGLTGDHDSKAETRNVVVDTLNGTNNARFEPQIGSTLSACAGNTASHLLNEEEEVHLMAVVRLIAPLFGRTHLDGTVMKLRSTPVVLGPSAEGRVYSSGFLDPTDFTDAYTESEVKTLAYYANDAGHGFDYVLMLLVLGIGADLATAVPILRSRIRSEWLAPEHTATLVSEERLRVESADGVLELVRD